MEQDAPKLQTVKLIECPRDAMQGWRHFIPTEKKVEYINQLLQVGFDTIDFGSFVSAKAIPQMADTNEVINQISLEGSVSQLLAIVANVRGAEEAASFEKIAYLGFPFSISPTFQMRNTHSTIEESLQRVIQIQNICAQSEKKLVVYISMAFGNPYGDDYNITNVGEWIKQLTDQGVEIISLADTVGMATPSEISSLFQKVANQFPNTEIGVHLHSAPQHWKEKTAAAFDSGCYRFDGALKGIGGCPMANDDLVGNMNMEMMIPYFEKEGVLSKIDHHALSKASQIASEIFI